MTCCVKYYLHIKHRHHSSISHHIHAHNHSLLLLWVGHVHTCAIHWKTVTKHRGFSSHPYCTLVMSGLVELKKKIKKGHPLGVEQTHGWLYRDFPHILCTWSFRECRRHYSSWEVSRESQSSPLRFFVESIYCN